MNAIEKKSQISLMSAVLVGLIALPAQADTANVQSTSQDAVVSGDNNQVTQVTNQVIINHPGRGLANRLEDKKAKVKVKVDRNNGNNGNHNGSNSHDDEDCED